MGLTVNRRMAKKISLLGVKIDEFQLLSLKRPTEDTFRLTPEQIEVNR